MVYVLIVKEELDLWQDAAQGLLIQLSCRERQMNKTIPVVIFLDSLGWFTASWFHIGESKYKSAKCFPQKVAPHLFQHPCESSFESNLFFVFTIVLFELSSKKY